MEQKNPRNPDQPEEPEKYKSAYDLLERQRCAQPAARHANLYGARGSQLQNQGARKS